jgi:pyrroloquinoline quinone biosynthesis protein D
MNAATQARLQLGEASIPALPRHVRLHNDEARERWVILVPERVLVPDETAIEVVRLCDGRTTIGTIVDGLAEKYAAPRAEIAVDVIAMLQDLADKGYLIDAGREA